MPANDTAASNQVCPHIGAQSADIVQPPGMGVPPIGSIDAHQTNVAAALAAKSSDEAPIKTVRGVPTLRTVLPT